MRRRGVPHDYPLWPLMALTLAFGAVPLLFAPLLTSGNPGATPRVASNSIAPPIATAVPARFQAAGYFHTACPSSLPVKVTLQGLVVGPGEPGYAATSPLYCYDTAADAEADGRARTQLAAGTAPLMPASTPVAAPGRQTSSSGDTTITGRLLRSAIANNALPAVFSAPVVSSSATIQQMLAGTPDLVGEVDIALTGPDTQDLIAYLVFSSDDAAVAALRDVRLGPDEDNPQDFFPYGLDTLARCRSAGSSTPDAGRVGATACFAQSGSVLIVGLSAAADPGDVLQHGSPARAIALLATGIRHFAAVMG
jgi:hypothetical protein